MKSFSSSPSLSSLADCLSDLIRVINIVTIVNDVGGIDSVVFFFQTEFEHLAFVLFKVVIPRFNILDNVLVYVFLLKDVQFSLFFQTRHS